MVLRKDKVTQFIFYNYCFNAFRDWHSVFSRNTVLYVIV